MFYDCVYAPIEGLEIARELGKELTSKKTTETPDMSGKEVQEQVIIPSNKRLRELGSTDKVLLELGLLPTTVKN